MAIDTLLCKTIARKHDKCGITEELGRIIHAAFVKKGQWATIFDIDPAVLVANLLAAEQIGDAFILRDTTGNLAETQNTSAGRGKRKEVSTTLDHSFTVLDHEPVMNVGFWDNIKATINNWDFIGFSQTRGWIQTNQSANVQSTMAIEDNLDEYVKITGIVNWTSKPHLTPFLYDEPALAVYPTAGDVALTANGDGVAGGTSPNLAYSIADTGNIDALFSLASGADVFSVVLVDGETLPAGVSIVGNTLSGTASGVGTETFKVCVASVYGLETVVEITYTVS